MTISPLRHGLATYVDEVISTTSHEKSGDSWKDTVHQAVVNRNSVKRLLEKARREKLRTLAGFLPRIVLQNLAALTPESICNMLPNSQRLEGAVVVLFDLCKFTKLAEGLRRGDILLSDGNERSTRPTHRYSASSLIQRSTEMFDSNEISQSYHSTLLSTTILRIQNTEKEQAGYGAEQLKDLLKLFFQELMGTLTDHGGDVLRLAGDALIAVFHDERASGGDEVAKAQLVQRAALVSMLALRRLDGRNIRGLDLHLHVALGIGPVDLYVLGDRRLGWQYVAAGEPFKSLDTALDDGTAGQMVVSPSMWEGLQKFSLEEYEHQLLVQTKGNPILESGETLRKCCEWDAEELKSGNFRLSLKATADDLEAVLKLDAAYEKKLGNDYTGAAKAAIEAVLAKADALERVVRLFTLPPILYACEAETSGWFAEGSRVVVIFINVALDRRPDLNTMQRVFSVLQGTMTAFHGIIKEFSQDDKGIVMVGALGLPPLTGSNPAARACLAALRVVANLGKMGAQAYVGISMGQVFTASIGSSRREYGMFGDVVNTAARLMGAGKKDATLVPALATVSQLQKKTGTTPRSLFSTTNKGSRKLWDTGSTDFSRKWAIIVEKEVHSAANSQIEFYSGGNIEVKGKSQRIEVYLPVRGRHQMSIKQGGDESLAYIGHRGLRARLTNRISHLTQGMGGGMVVLQGAPGTGKSRLLSVCAPEWRKQRVAVLGIEPFNVPAHGSGRRVEVFLQRSTSDGQPIENGFLAWRATIRDLVLLLKPKVLASAGYTQFLPTSLSLYASRGFPAPTNMSATPRLSKLFPFKTNEKKTTDTMDLSKVLSFEEAANVVNSDEESILTIRSQPPAFGTDDLSNGPPKIENANTSNSKSMRRRHSIADASSTLQRKMSKMAGKIQFQIKGVRALGKRRVSLQTNVLPKSNLELRTTASEPVEDYTDEENSLPWWAGAFQGDNASGTLGLVDSRQTRGQYLLELCKEFMPQNYVKATQVLCELLTAECPLMIEKAHTPRTVAAMGARPDKAEFDVLMGVITIAALIDASLPLLIIIDAEHPIDSQSCDLLKATIKYLNDRVLFIITSPPLPWKGNESPHNAGKLSTPPNVKTLRGEYNTRLLDIEENESEVDLDEFEDDNDSDGGFSYDEESDEDENSPEMDSDAQTVDTLNDHEFLRPGSSTSMHSTSKRLAEILSASKLQQSLSDNQLVSPRGADLFNSCNPRAAGLTGVITSLGDSGSLCQTMHVGSLGYWQCSDLAGSFFGGVELTPLSSLALYLRTQGNPFYITEYCKFAMENELGLIINSEHDPVPTSGSESQDEDGDEKIEVEKVPEAAMSIHTDGHEEGLWWALNPTKNACRMLQNVIPLAIEEQLMNFLSCLTAQQFFVLKVLSVIGVFDISTELLEHIYPIPVIPERSILDDVQALEACKIVWIRVDNGKMFVTFRDLILHQIVYQRLSYYHRRELHNKLAEFYDDLSHNGECEGSRTIPKSDLVPHLIHHYNLAQEESKATIWVGVIGVRELELWAIADFQRLINACLPYVPLHSRKVPKTYRDIMWFSPSLAGILRTLAAIRSGPIVRTVATSLFAVVKEKRLKDAEVAEGMSAPRTTTLDLPELTPN